MTTRAKAFVEAAIGEEVGEGPLARALRALVPAPGAGGVPSQVSSNLVYQPNGPTPLPPNTFTDLHLLAAAARLIPGPKTVTFDPTFAPGNIPVPAGNYDFRYAGGEENDTTWRADPTKVIATMPTIVQLADGVTLQGIGGFDDVMVLAQNTGVPVIVATPRATAWWVRGYGAVHNTGTQPFISDTIPGHDVLVDLKGDAELVPGTAPFIFMGTPGQFLLAVTQDESIVGASTLAGVAGSTYGGRVGDAASFIDPNQPGLPGAALSVAFGEQSQYVQYTPTTPAQWAGSPQSVREAIDRLANAIFTGLPPATPIP